MTKTCKTCSACDTPIEGDMSLGECNAVRHPITGDPLPVFFARKDQWEGYELPCGYAGNLWKAKDG